MKNKMGLSIISAILSGIMLINFVGCSKPATDNSGNTAGNDVVNEIDIDSAYPTIPKSVVKLSSVPVSKDMSSNTITLSIDKMNSYGVTYKANDNEGLKSYAVSGGVDVAYDTSVDGFYITDAVTVDNEIGLEQIYYQSNSAELTLDEIYADYYEVEIDYTESGRVQAIYYLDSYYSYNYDSAGRLTSVYKDAELYKSAEYNAVGKIISETNRINGNSINKDYSYTTDGQLYSSDGDIVVLPTISNNKITVADNVYTINNKTVSGIEGLVSASFSYDYTFNGDKYLTNKTINGETTEYCYLGDKVVGIRKGGSQLNYILDNKLNYIGLKFNDQKYYFDVDPFGNILGLFDCDGIYTVQYYYDVWGTLIGISGEQADTLGAFNEICNMGGLYDATLNAYFINSQLYLPEYGVVLASGSENCTSAKSTYEWGQNSYFTRSAATDFARIHDKVVSVVVNNFKEAGLDVVSNLYAVDDAGNSKRLVDIYTLDYSLTPFSAMNLIDGNQVYEVIYHSPDSMAFETIANNKLQNIINDCSVSYFADYTATKGTMKFNGQFIFCNYLIDYKCDGAGIIEYQVKINKKSNYDQSVNIYDYDNGKYVCYVNNTFDLDFLDGVTIIPGISRETFDVIDNYLSDYLQTVAGDICDQMLIYDDPAYYNMSEMNVHPDYWSQMNLDDPTTFLEIQANGSVKVQKMPAVETEGFQTKLLIGVGVILVTAVVATVALAIPGANCVVVSICVGAAKGAIAGALSGFAFGFVEEGVNSLVTGITTGEWNYNFDNALNKAAEGFATGAITGAIMGGISGGLNPQYCFEAGTSVATATGAVAIENVAVGDKVWSYDYLTGTKSLQTVTATSVRHTNELVKLTVGGETIVTTPRHPFYVVNSDNFSGYTAAKFLSVGDCILTADGNYATISSIESVTTDEPTAVYNLTVEDNHSYYVGENELLVHNVNGCSGLSSDGQKAVANATKNGKLKVDAHVYSDHNLSSLSRPNKITTRFSVTGKNNIDNVISLALKNPTLDKVQGTRVVIESTFSQTVGWSETGEALKTVRVVIDELGKIVSAYPI